MLFRRARRYLWLHADPRIGGTTSFFLAASIVTRQLAHRVSSEFFLELSAILEIANTQRARQIRCRTLYRGGCLESNTWDFVTYEQGLVQRRLDALHESNPARYASEIRAANAAFGMLRFRPLRFFGDRCFVRSVEETVADLGRPIDMAERRCREVLGMRIARHAVRMISAPSA